MKRLISQSALILAAINGPLAAQTKGTASTKPAVGPVSAKDSAAFRDQARAALAAGDLETTERLVERTRSVVTPAERTAWWLIESELEFAKQRFAKSAVAAMQIVILHPKSGEVGLALYWAGRSYEELGRPAKAIDLYQECVALNTAPSATRNAANARLRELKKKAP